MAVGLESGGSYAAVSTRGRGPGVDSPTRTVEATFFFINLVRMFAWADLRDQSLH